MENKFSQVWGNREWQWVETDKHCWKHMHVKGNGPDMVRAVTNFLPKDKRKLIIQAGGNCGMVPLEYSKYFDRVVTFEPDPLNFKCLVANIPSKRVTSIQACLGSKSGELVPMRNNGKNIGSCHVSEAPPTFHAMTFMIDSLHLAPNVIHLDVEGYELEVLKGAKKTIKRHKPVIVSEIKDDKRFDFWEFIREYSYTEKAKLSNGDYVYVSKG